MKFYGRDEEIALLRKMRDNSADSAQFCVLTGRRRIGKTSLLRHALEDGRLKYVHLPITRQPEKPLVRELQREVERVLELEMLGTCENFAELFDRMMKASRTRNFTLVLDEFQEFERINPAVFSQIAAIWDREHENSKLNLVVCGSINRLINRIFLDDGEPLYGRNTALIRLKPFKTSLLKEILSSYKADYTNDDLLALWTVSGGVARYVDMMMREKAFDRDRMIDVIFSQGSAYLEEGRTILAEEFGPDYGTYFAILSMIASGATTSAEMKNLLGVDINGYLTKLERDYALVTKKIPFGGKESSKTCHYQIDDCFFRFWFRFVFKYRGLLELDRYDQMRTLARRDFNAFAGYSLERYFHWKFVEESTYTKMEGWWDRKGENEIDLVLEDEFANTLDFREVKLDASRYRRDELQSKTAVFFAKNPELRSRRMSIGLLSVAEM